MRRIRAVAHVHSRWSYDGSWSLGEIARAFAARGYDAVLMAEHDRGFDDDRWRSYQEECERLSSVDFLLVPGIEYSDHANAVHVPVWGDLPFMGEGLETSLLLGEVASRQGTAVLAHPRRRDAYRKIAPGWLKLLGGLEIWNRKYDGWSPSRPALGLLAEAPHLVPFVGLDFHTAHQFFPLGMTLEVEGFKPLDIYAAMAMGRCRPAAFRIPAQWLSREPVLTGLQTAEIARQHTAPRMRVRRDRLRGMRRAGGGRKE